MPVPPEDVGDGERRPQRPLVLDAGLLRHGLVSPPPLVQPVHVGGIAAAESVPDGWPKVYDSQRLGYLP